MKERTPWADAACSRPGETAAMKITSRLQRLILDAAIDRSDIHGTLTADAGARRDFLGSLELNPALGFCLGAGLARLELKLWIEELRRLRACELEEGCERQSELFVDRWRMMPVRLA